MRLISNSPHATEEIGFQIGTLLQTGDTVGLYGNLGSGKTVMVKGIARSFHIDSRDITSASFTIIAEYQTQPPFFHIDLYRITNDSELDSTGIWDCLGGNAISVIEWAEKLGDEVPDKFIAVHIDVLDDEQRALTIEGIDEKNWNYL